MHHKNENVSFSRFPFFLSWWLYSTRLLPKVLWFIFLWEMCKIWKLHVVLSPHNLFTLETLSCKPFHEYIFFVDDYSEDHDDEKKWIWRFRSQYPFHNIVYPEHFFPSFFPPRKKIYIAIGTTRNRMKEQLQLATLW